MNPKLSDLLKSLDDKVNPAVQGRIMDCHKRALNWEPTGRLPLVVTYPYPEGGPFQPVPHREIFSDPEKMLYNELLHAFSTSILHHATVGDDLPYTIRANFGTVLVSSILGGKVEQVEDAPPWVVHFDTMEAFLSIFERGGRGVDYTSGLAKQVIDTYDFYRTTLAGYPNLEKCLNIVLPDLQGPLDTLELLRGSDLFLDFLMEPEMVERGLSLVAKTQAEYARALKARITDRHPGYSFQHNMMIKGNILIRDDSAIMISPEMYKTQVARFDEQVLSEMGGGGIHSCGTIDFSIPEIYKLPSLRCFDFGQSHLNKMEDVYKLSREKKIPLIRVRPGRELLLSGKITEYYPTGVSLVYDAESFEEACAVSKQYSDLYGSNWE